MRSDVVALRNWQIFFHTLERQIWRLSWPMSAYVSTCDFSPCRIYWLAYLIPSHTDTSLYIKKSMFQNFTKHIPCTSLNDCVSRTKPTENSFYCYFLLLFLHIYAIGNRVSFWKDSNTKRTTFGFWFPQRKIHNVAFIMKHVERALQISYGCQ